MNNKLLIATLSTLTFTANAFQLPESPLMSYDCQRCQTLDKQDIDYSWLLENKVIRQANPLLRQSNSYRQIISAQELAKGIDIFTTGEQAVIRINGSENSLINSQLEITTPDQKTLPLIQASKQLVNDETLKNLPYFENAQTVFQLKPELGKGHFVIKLSQPMVKSDEKYSLHVFDKFSSTSLNIQTDKTNYIYNETITINIQLSDDSILYPIDRIDATIINPEGKQSPLRLERVSSNRYKAYTTIVSKDNSKGENWYVRVDTQTLMDDQILYRHATSAFAYTIPSAKIENISLKDNKVKGSAFSAMMDVSTTSRYALEAVLYGTNDEGQLIPMMEAQTAHWLEPGKHQIAIEFDDKKFNQSSLHSPFALGNLKIIDYGQLRPVYTYNEIIPFSSLK